MPDIAAKRAAAYHYATLTSQAMRVFLASTCDDLEAYRKAACDIVQEAGWVIEEPSAEHQADTVKVRGKRVANAHVTIAIVGWQRGPVPGPEQGGDSRRSWAEWELNTAFHHARPVVVLKANDNWPPETRENDPVLRAHVADHRAELEQLAVGFGPGPEGLAEFRASLRLKLKQCGATSWLGSGISASSSTTFRLRHIPLPELPPAPYPLLLPYTHPKLLAGRDRELTELKTLLRREVPILGLHAPSGAGKSSLLAGGLVPSLRAGGLPVALERHPHEPGLAARLLGDLLEGDLASAVDDRDPLKFVNRLLTITRLAGAPPLLVLDQFEDVLKNSAGSSRAVVGALLAASAQRQPGFNAPPCRWLLAYRREYHGQVCTWLSNVLKEAHAEEWPIARTLPHDLSGPERFHAWGLPPLGAQSPGNDPLAEAEAIFKAAIEQPLSLESPDGGRRYPWRFSGDGATRLAQAFAEARVADPQAPLTPELQVVLAHLLEGAGKDGLITVPEEPRELIGRALEQHLSQGLAAAFPGVRNEEARRGRTRALLVLRELADSEGQRLQGQSAVILAQGIGCDGHTVLERLSTPRTRLVVPSEGPDGRSYTLAHDRLAEVVVRAVEQEGRRDELGVDPELLGLRRFVALKTQLFSSGEIKAATEVGRTAFRSIAANTDALLWGEERQRWWASCVSKRRLRQRRRILASTAFTVALIVIVAGLWQWTAFRGARQALLEQLAGGEPAAALAAFHELYGQRGIKPEILRAQLRKRKSPGDIVGSGLLGVKRRFWGEVVLRVVEIALPLVEQSPEDPVLVANLVWALDYGPSRQSGLKDAAQAMRDRALEPLRRLRAPPLLPGPNDGSWSAIPGGTFRMGDTIEGTPAHEVTVSAFRISTTEVTSAEYRRLVAEYEGNADLPVSVTWYEAYRYAAWLGGRLPTEAEWEYAARANCDFTYCTHSGAEASLDDVAWTLRNSMDPVSLEKTAHPVAQLEPNPWGLYDVIGNHSEWTGDWFWEFNSDPERTPPEILACISSVGRVYRGGSAAVAAKFAHPTHRNPGLPEDTPFDSTGLRVVIPIASER